MTDNSMIHYRAGYLAGCKGSADDDLSSLSADYAHDEVSPPDDNLEPVEYDHAAFAAFATVERVRHVFEQGFRAGLASGIRCVSV